MKSYKWIMKKTLCWDVMYSCVHTCTYYCDFWLYFTRVSHVQVCLTRSLGLHIGQLVSSQATPQVVRSLVSSGQSVVSQWSRPLCRVVSRFSSKVASLLGVFFPWKDVLVDWTDVLGHLSVINSPLDDLLWRSTWWDSSRPQRRSVGWHCWPSKQQAMGSVTS